MIDFSWPQSVGALVEMVRDVVPIGQADTSPVIVLRGVGSFPSLAKRVTTGDKAFAEIVMGLRMYGYTVIVVEGEDEGRRGHVRDLKRLIGFDSVVETGCIDTGDAAAFGIRARVHRSFGVSEDCRQLLRLEFRPGAAWDDAWTRVRTSRGRDEDLRLLAPLVRKGWSDRKIQCELGLSLAMVKKRKRELRERLAGRDRFGMAELPSRHDMLGQCWKLICQMLESGDLASGGVGLRSRASLPQNRGEDGCPDQTRAVFFQFALGFGSVISEARKPAMPGAPRHSGADPQWELSVAMIGREGRYETIPLARGTRGEWETVTVGQLYHLLTKVGSGVLSPGVQ
jgi:hypothetical protein